MITLEQIGPEGLQRQVEEQNREELQLFSGQGATDIAAPLPSSLGFGGAVTRKTDAAQRVIIDEERHKNLILSEIWRLYRTKEGRQHVGRHVRITRNVLQRTADALAVVYEREPVRKLGSRRAAQAWRDAVIDGAHYNIQAEGWARYAFITNVVHVIPAVVEGQVGYTTILPHAADVVFDAGDTDPSILVYLSRGDGYDRVAVDNERFWYFDNWKLVGEIEHGYRDLRGRPMQPWVQWRTMPRLDHMDYWQRGKGRKLVDATLGIAVVNAAKAAVRQTSNSKQKVLQTRSIADDVAPGQVLTSEHALNLRNDGAFSVHDLIVPVQEFLADMDSIEREIAESYGVPVGVINTQHTTDDHREFVAVSKQRQKQAKSLHVADVETSIKTAIIMRAEGHPLTARLDPERFKRTFQLKFAPHTFAERPKDRLANYRDAMALGLMDQVTARMLEHPDEDEATAEREVRATIDRRNEFANLLAVRNLSGDPGQDGDNIAALQGRTGGLMRAANSNPDGDDERRINDNEQQ